MRYCSKEIRLRRKNWMIGIIILRRGSRRVRRRRKNQEKVQEGKGRRRN